MERLLRELFLMRTDPITLAAALRTLANDIESQDGVGECCLC